MLTVITGGARGKSRFADSLCREATRVLYVATDRPYGEEMRIPAGIKSAAGVPQ